jgi:hypothetical protein
MDKGHTQAAGNSHFQHFYFIKGTELYKRSTHPGAYGDDGKKYSGSLAVMAITS